MALIPRRVRSLALLALVNAVADAAFLPLVPAIRDDLGLTGGQTGALLAATTAATLVATLPAGQLAARLGARPLLLGAAVAMPVSLVAMALAPGLGPLLAARVLFGLSFAINWSIAPGAAAARVPGAAGTAALLVVSGVGWLVGPVASGALASAWGWRAPLLALGVLAIPTVVPFLRGEREGLASPLSVGELLALLGAAPRIAWAAVVAGLLGLVTGVVGVLVPTLLADNGVGPAGIGGVVAVSSVVWVLAAALSGRVGRPRIGIRLVGLTVAGLALCTALPVVSLSTGMLAGFLVLAAACRAPLGALIYPLATRSSDDEAGASAIASLLNLAWAVPALLAPLLAGAALQHGLARGAFAVVCVAAFAVAVAMLGASRRPATA